MCACERVCLAAAGSPAWCVIHNARNIIDIPLCGHHRALRIAEQMLGGMLKRAGGFKTTALTQPCLFFFSLPRLLRKATHTYVPRLHLVRPFFYLHCSSNLSYQWLLVYVFLPRAGSVSEAFRGRTRRSGRRYRLVLTLLAVVWCV